MPKIEQWNSGSCWLVSYLISFWHHVYLSTSVTDWNIKLTVSTTTFRGWKKINEWKQIETTGDIIFSVFILCFLNSGLMPHHISFWLYSMCVSFSASSSSSFSLCRLEFQHGFSLPVPQLESFCGGVRVAVCLCSGRSHFYAWEPSLLPGGKSERETV